MTIDDLTVAVTASEGGSGRPQGRTAPVSTKAVACGRLKRVVGLTLA